MLKNKTIFQTSDIPIPLGQHLGKNKCDTL